ncbi:MAG TPA: glycosyltransferase [Polyangia bacterium]|nr:glycosyltransferase [Polyangia bacterium]
MTALLVALVALSVLVYTYAGYPLLVAALARWFPQPIRQDPTFAPTVTACVAAHDAAAYLDQKLESLWAQEYPKLDVIVYDDGSSDRTAEVARAHAVRGRPVRVLQSPARGGKPSAIARMRELARSEVLLMTDARQPLAPGALPALLGLLAPPEVGCVSGNLVLEGAAGAGVYWRYEKWIRRSEGRFRGLVGVSGAIYAVRREDLPALDADLILDDMWVPMRLRLAGRRILFCEQAFAFDRAFEDPREFGRKVRTLAGSYQLFARMPALLSPRANPSWFETVSHKLMRLLCPWALLALLVASVAGARTRPATLGVLAAGQVLCYLLAAAGPLAGRLGALARTFVVLNAAAVLGLWRHLRGSQRVTW